MLRMLNRAVPVAVLCGALGGCVTTPQVDADRLLTVNHFVPHVSTVPANAGQLVGLYVRQKALARVAQQFRGAGEKARVVLFVHGTPSPSVPVFDLEYQNYNWMAYLARAGFNVFSVDLTGYGASPRPMMDDPCNVDPKQQALITPRPLKAACAPNHAQQLNTIRNDWEEINAVVDYLRHAYGVARINMVGWSAGGPRVGGYAAQYPEKVERVVLYAPSPTIAGLQIPEHPGPGFPVTLRSREDLEKKTWDPGVRCPGQVEPGARDVVWKAVMQWDRIGASWGPADGVVRGRTATRFGWTPDLAAKVTAPALVVVGEFDRPNERRTVYEQLSSQDKVFLDVACASHFMVWEKQRRVLHEASLEWLTSGRVKNVPRGEFRVDADGKYNLTSGGAATR